LLLQGADSYENHTQLFCSTRGLDGAVARRDSL